MSIFRVELTKDYDLVQEYPSEPESLRLDFEGEVEDTDVGVVHLEDEENGQLIATIDESGVWELVYFDPVLHFSDIDILRMGE